MTTVPKSSTRLEAAALPYLVAYCALALGCVGIAIYLSPVAAAPLYVVGMGVLTTVRPSLALCTVFGLAPLAYDLSTGIGARFSASEINLAIILVTGLATGRIRIALGPLWPPTIAYFGACVVSLIVRGLDPLVITVLIQMAVYIVFAIVVFATVPRSGRECLLVMKSLLPVGAVLAVSALVSRSGYTLGLHKNSTGASLCACATVALGLFFEATTVRGRRIYMALLLLFAASLVVVMSRGAMLGFLVGAVVMGGAFGRLKDVLRVTLVTLPLVALVWVLQPEDRRASALDFGVDAHNTKARLEMIDYAWSRFQESPLIGVGVGLRKEYDATNVVMSTLAETGVVGLLAFTWLMVAMIRVPLSLRTAFPKGSPEAAVIAIGAALIWGKIVHGLFDHFWGRGAGTCAFAAVGMCLMLRMRRGRARAIGEA